MGRFSKISVIGMGISNKTDILGEILDILNENNEQLEDISVSEIRITFLIDKANVNTILNLIHNKFLN